MRFAPDATRNAETSFLSNVPRRKRAGSSLRFQRLHSHVLLSNVPCADQPGGLDGVAILRAYKAPNGVEMNFRFLKDPVIVNETFLKKQKWAKECGPYANDRSEHTDTKRWPNYENKDGAN